MMNVNISKKENRSEYEKQLREVHRILNRCTECGKRDAYVMAGRALCSNCAEKERTWKAISRRRNPEHYSQLLKDDYERAKANHKCVRCRRPLPPDRQAVTCQRCNQLSSQRRRERLASDSNYLTKAEKIAANPTLCVRCLKKPRYRDYKLCESCYHFAIVAAEKGRINQK